MFLSNWLCNKSSKSQFVKIVYPGGHVELHDRPIRASEIMLQNPKFCVAQPCVFQKPWAIVEPETVLMLGQKFYVIPKSTIRKLQRFSLKYSPIVNNHRTESMISPSSSSTGDENQDHDHDHDHDHHDKEGLFSDRLKDYFFRAIKMRGNNNNNNGVYLRETRGFFIRKKSRTLSLRRGSSNRLASLDQTSWQPNLESVTEERD